MEIGYDKLVYNKVTRFIFFLRKICIFFVFMFYQLQDILKINKIRFWLSSVMVVSLMLGCIKRLRRNAYER